MRMSSQGRTQDFFKGRGAFLKLGHNIWFQNIFSDTYTFTYTLKLLIVGRGWTPIFANFPPISIYLTPIQRGTWEYVYIYKQQRYMKKKIESIMRVITTTKQLLW